MAVPIGLIISGAIEAIQLGAEILAAHNTGSTQEDLEVKWQAMQARLRDANARWEAAGPQT